MNHHHIVKVPGITAGQALVKISILVSLLTQLTNLLMPAEDTTQYSKIDLSNCEKERIHLTQYIQPHGFLLSVSFPDLNIAQVSENLDEIIPGNCQELIGQHLTVFPCHGLIEILQIGLNNKQFENLNPTLVKFEVNSEVNQYNLIVHQSQDILILEFEPLNRVSMSTSLSSMLTGALSKLQNSLSLQQLFKNTAEEVKRITGYDRVMVYRFADDWHGEVVAEALNTNMEPFLGLHYPASDIPKQARELYLKNLVRIIVDVNASNSPIIPYIPPEKTEPSDLSNSVLRAVSPVHTEYLQNMGVQATLTISLIKEDNLWGLIACHHGTAKFMDFNLRSACKLLSQVFSYALNYKLDEEDLKNSEHKRATSHFLFEKMAQEWDVIRGMVAFEPNVTNLIDSTGVTIALDDQVVNLGKTPDNKQITRLINWLYHHMEEDIYATHKLSEKWPAAESLLHVASGILVICLNRPLKEYIIWYRPENVSQISWGGNPHKPVKQSGNGEEQLSPRKSFAKWTEEIHGTSKQWASLDLEVADKLREDISYILLQKSNEFRRLNDHLNLINKDLDAFTHTVSHDLRSPLTIIKSYAELVKEELQSEPGVPIEKMLSKIIESTDRMDVMISDILKYSKVGKDSLDIEEIPLQPLADRIIKDLKVQNSSRNIEFTTEGLNTLWANATMLEQMVHNLLSNAVKYSKYSDPAEVVLKATEQDDQTVIEVQDNGLGIDMKDAEKIFKLFTRLHDQSEFEGSGVGLSIVKRIVERHQGRIWVQSEPHKYTSFFVALPKPNSET